VGVPRVAHDYANYRQLYHPEIADSKLLGSADTKQSCSVRSLHRVLFVAPVPGSHFVTRDSQVDTTRWYIVADSTLKQDVENYGQPNERVLPPDRGKRFIRRT